MSRHPEPQIVRDRVESPHTLGQETDFVVDVVVVGSGAGGATVAAQLAEQGFRTLILEEGKFHTTSENTGDIISMMGQLMRDGGTTAILGKSPINYMEGRCLGGTTVLNGGMCWRTPEEVLHEWRTERALSGLTESLMDEIFTEVEETIDARYQDPGSEGGANQAFKRGADKLGWTLSMNRRNQEHCVGSNDCVTGCPSGAKRSTIFTWLPRYLKAGGRILTGMKVERLLHKNGKVTAYRVPFRIHIGEGIYGSSKVCCISLWCDPDAATDPAVVCTGAIVMSDDTLRFIRTSRWRRALNHP